VNANPKIFITANKYFRKLSNNIASTLSISNQYLTDEDMGKTLDAAYSTLIASESDLFKLQGNDFDYLFKRSSESVPVVLSDLIMQTLQEYRENEVNNKFLEALEIHDDGDFIFIGIDNRKLKPNGFIDDMNNGWKDLMQDYPELAQDIVKYAYHQS
jgi:hypothetical protein